MHTAIEWAMYIVNKCIDENCPISNLQLQKILYYIQREFLRQDKIAFYDEIEAWQFGPVVPKVYYYYCGHGAMPISFTLKDFTQVDFNEKAIVDPIIEEKRVFNPWELVAETHQPGGAWDRIYNRGIGNKQCIPRELIKKVG